MFQLTKPLTFRQLASPLNRLLQYYRINEKHTNILSAYSNGDYVLYADLPEMHPIEALEENGHFIGPVVWSTPVPLPDWWKQVTENKPIIYVNFGSFGNTKRLET